MKTSQNKEFFFYKLPRERRDVTIGIQNALFLDLMNILGFWVSPASDMWNSSECRTLLLVIVRVVCCMVYVVWVSLALARSGQKSKGVGGGRVCSLAHSWNSVESSCVLPIPQQLASFILERVEKAQSAPRNRKKCPREKNLVFVIRILVMHFKLVKHEVEFALLSSNFFLLFFLHLIRLLDYIHLLICLSMKRKNIRNYFIKLDI